MTTGTIIAISGIAYICMGLLFSAALHKIVTESGKKCKNRSLIGAMFLSVLIWPIFYLLGFIKKLKK